MARRSRPVRKLLDEPLKVAGILTLRSCGVVFCVYGVSHFVGELLFGLWTRLMGAWALFGPLGCAVVVGFVLRLAEAYDDEHAVPSAIRFFLSRRSRHVYAAGATEAFRPRPTSPLAWSPRALPEWMYRGLWCRVSGEAR